MGLGLSWALAPSGWETRVNLPTFPLMCHGRCPSDTYAEIFALVLVV